jgi:hypothetical protein
LRTETPAPALSVHCLKTLHRMVAVLLFLGAAVSRAAPLCRDVLMADRVTVSEEAVGVFGKDSYERVLRVADGLLGTLSIPDATTVKILGREHHPGGAGHNSFTHEVTATLAQQTRYTGTILSHEYGHAVFDKNIGLRNPKYNLIPVLYLKMGSMTDAQKVDFLKLIFVRRAYHELFADTMAVVVKKDLRGNRDALEIPEPTEDRRDVETVLRYWVGTGSRDFTAPWNPEVAKIWSSLIESSKLKNKDPYFWLAPARTFLGEKLKPLLKQPERRRHILEQVFDILYKEMDQIMSQDAFDVFINDPMTYNLRLKTEFEKLH